MAPGRGAGGAAARPTGGVLALVSALLLWSLYPFYFRLVAFVPVGEITAHRILWSTLLLAVWAPLAEGIAPLLRLFRRPRDLLGLVLSSALLLAAWIAYVWAVTSDRVQEASLGYFLSPLTAVAVGVLALREPLRPAQRVALALAVVAVAFELWRTQTISVLALVLACAFSLYGALRKHLEVPPLTGLFVECLVALPFALLWLAREAATAGLAFAHGGTLGLVLVLLSGAVTVAPLWLFHLGARRLPYVTVGILLYLPPSAVFLEAVWLFGEPLPVPRLLTFALVWAAVAVHTADAVLAARRQAPSTAARGV
ncbi:hypothetical protein HRbin40_00068 [bacterium HR40]|nr:hypothetical protein HRbin40_00068 [bacterium HR40]